MKSKLYASLAVSALALAFSGYASAAAIDCTGSSNAKTSDATAKGADEDERIADFCAYSTETTNPESEEKFVWDLFGEDFIYIGKWEDGEDGEDGEHKEAELDFTFTVTQLTTPTTIDGVDYNFSYSLEADPNTIWNGATIDWVLGIKDGSGSAGVGGFVAYYWQSLTLDIDGGFSSFFSEPEVFSHASAFVRLAEGTGPIGDIPEPATLGLLGIGLFGLGMASYRRRRLASTEV